MASFDRRCLQRIGQSLIDVAYPPRCAGCGLRGCWVCDECLAATPLFGTPRCPVCSMPETGRPCDCAPLPNGLDRIWIAGPYEGWLRAAIYAFKFNGETARATYLAGLLAEGCAELGGGAALASVPLHPKRKRQRGYDQTAILADQVSKQSDMPRFVGLVKVRHTPHQVGLNAADRSLNLRGAFTLLPDVPVPGRVVLVDDVTTTGSTLSECATALRAGGATWVGAVVIAHDL